MEEEENRRTNTSFWLSEYKTKLFRGKQTTQFSTQGKLKFLINSDLLKTTISLKS